jgi:nicotinamide-nucleotide amidase
MHAEVVVTGTELLLGDVIDTNSAMIARMLRDIGLDLYYKSAVGDNQERVAEVLKVALERSDIVITSGGLGPTVDDVTREAVADATHRPLVFHQELMDQIAARFVRFGRPFTENNRRQAYVPEGALVVENAVGTAPAFIVEDDHGTVICLPGVPGELEYLMKEHIIPYLRRRMGKLAIIWTKVLRTCTIGESQLDSLIADLMTGSNPTIGLAAHPGQVDIRITAKAGDQSEADRLIAPLEAELHRRLGKVIYGEGEQTLEGVVSQLLAERGLTLAIADSVTAGQVADRLRDTPHPEVVAEARHYPNPLGAARALEVDPQVVLSQPQQVAQQLARSTREAARASLGLAVFGMITASNAPADEPPQAYLALCSDTCKAVRSFRFGNEDSVTRRWLSTRALDLVRRYLIGGLDK